VTQDDLSVEEFEYYEELYDPQQSERLSRHSRKAELRRVAKKPHFRILAELDDLYTGASEPSEGSFITTYRPSEYEADWLLSSLRAFYDQDLLSDVLALVKGGKEASVYRCLGGRNAGGRLVAAKVFRPSKFRSLRNDSLYREGRAILLSGGRPLDESDGRVMRAIRSKSALGVQVQRTSWIMHEYAALQRLHRAGGAVPEPIASTENALLMGYCGDERMAAPTLQQVSLSPKEAPRLFQETLRNIELMLQQGLIHGDLSAYNILYWKGKITLIDFPQAVDCYTNRSARPILQRDVARVCAYFARQGVESVPEAITRELWQRYVGQRSIVEQELLMEEVLSTASQPGR